MTRTSVDEPIHRPGSSRLLFSQLRPAIPPSSRNSSGGVHDARAKDKGHTRGIDKVGSIHGSAAVMSTTSATPNNPSACGVPRGPLWRYAYWQPLDKRIEHWVDTDSPSHRDQGQDGGLCKQPTAQHVHDLMMAMPHTRDGKCRFSVCSLNVSPANHIAACRCRSQAESRGGGCAGEGREASKQASKRASDVEKKGRPGGRWLSPMLWDRRRGLHNGRRREVLCPLGTARSTCTTVRAVDTASYVPD